MDNNESTDSRKVTYYATMNKWSKSDLELIEFVKSNTVFYKYPILRASTELRRKLWKYYCKRNNKPVQSTMKRWYYIRDTYFKKKEMTPKRKHFYNYESKFLDGTLSFLDGSDDETCVYDDGGDDNRVLDDDNSVQGDGNENSQSKSCVVTNDMIQQLLQAKDDKEDMQIDENKMKVFINPCNSGEIKPGDSLKLQASVQIDIKTENDYMAAKEKLGEHFESNEENHVSPSRSPLNDNTEIHDRMSIETTKDEPQQRSLLRHYELTNEEFFCEIGSYIDKQFPIHKRNKLCSQIFSMVKEISSEINAPKV